MRSTLRFILDAEVVRVQAMNAAGHLAAQGVDTADVHLALLEFDNGAVASLENSWVLPRDLPLIFDFKMEIVGEKGSARDQHGTERHLQEICGPGPQGAGHAGCDAGVRRAHRRVRHRGDRTLRRRGDA